MHLKPCPFCGGEAEILELTDEANFGGSVISCKKCGASSPVHFDRKENLVSSWNDRRTPSDASPPQTVVDAYLGILVLRTMCKTAKLSGGVEASEQLLARMEQGYPALPALSALRTTPTYDPTAQPFDEPLRHAESNRPHKYSTAAVRDEIMRFMREDFDPHPNWELPAGEWDDNAEDVADKIVAAVLAASPIHAYDAWRIIKKWLADYAEEEAAFSRYQDNVLLDGVMTAAEMRKLNDARRQ